MLAIGKTVLRAWPEMAQLQILNVSGNQGYKS